MWIVCSIANEAIIGDYESNGEKLICNYFAKIEKKEHDVAQRQVRLYS